MSHRLFARIAFERALGNAAIRVLKDALAEKVSFAARTDWPKVAAFSAQYDGEALSAELNQIVALVKAAQRPGARFGRPPSIDNAPCAKAKEYLEAAPPCPDQRHHRFDQRQLASNLPTPSA